MNFTAQFVVSEPVREKKKRGKDMWEKESGSTAEGGL